ncbi:MAG: AhpC/TSA family protein [Tagaea sp.]|nr:AhpC/TSA family protein [Tagaea sp.]
METLAPQLDAFKAGWAERAGPEIANLIAADNRRLIESGLAERALKEGARFPDATLPDQLGRPVDLAALYGHGPLVVVFYRGGWCPYCNLELRAYQLALPRIAAEGGTLVAVSPETPDNSLDTAQKNELAFAVLSDSRGALAASLGIRFELSAEIKALYEKFGHDLPMRNGHAAWTLPVPATYVIDRDGRIAFAHVDPDYRSRAEPSAVVGALRRLAKQAA